ncbi:endonuclease/exonuclease/phosphatase family protein [Kordiimonas sp.]|uniref:endonuclease/exonuclease/phosphatase family protein n=1 Tax=Kordiimonas sp. TaxID=1970157 RepID=UPI003A95C364
MVKRNFFKMIGAGSVLAVLGAGPAACASDLPDTVPDQPGAAVTLLPTQGAAQAVLLNVLSYNIQGLPSPLKKHKTPLFERIAQILRERRGEGSQPQVVLLQEAFDSDASIIAEQTGYRYVLKGPGRKARSEKGRVHWAMQTRKSYMTFSDPQKFTGSGLYILSDYPIVEAQHKAFDSDMCAGIDCLSNKAILLARIAVPGLDEPLDIINSHFNSRGSAKAPSRHVLRAHQRQTDTLSWFMDKLCGGYPVIVAGDFNTKQRERYDYFRQTIQLVDAAEDCLSGEGDCALGKAAKRDNVLYKTNDKQFFRTTDKYRIIPTYIERNFTEEVDGRPLSDHLGYEVEYKITPLGAQTGKQQWALR